MSLQPWKRDVRLMFLLLGSGIAAAQPNLGYGELRGTVQDPSGAVLSAANVTLKNTATGLTRETKTDSMGMFHFVSALPGEYDVQFESNAFRTVIQQSVRVLVGLTTTLDVRLEPGGPRETITVQATYDLVDVARTHPEAFLSQPLIRNLPINRRDYLTLALLSAGAIDSKSMVDNTDLRVKQIPTSGISFFGSNGRGNSITVDGGEMNDGGGGVRSTISQDAVQEFQITRSNYSAEVGAASGGVINIVSRSATNEVHASAFLFSRNEALDAGDPFARLLDGVKIIRIKPPSTRQQFGMTFGTPVHRNRTFLFLSFEGLVRRESSVVSILTDRSIFGPTLQQQTVLDGLPAAQAAQLRPLLTSSPATIALFEKNSGVFPFTTDGYRSTVRLDHSPNSRNQFFLRFDIPSTEDSNANIQALVGASRGLQVSQFDPTAVFRWAHVSSAGFTNELQIQANYRHYATENLDKFGPELRIAGYGIFNRDINLPGRNIERRYEIKENVSIMASRHLITVGGQAWIRSAFADDEVFFDGRFTFGDLPGSILNPSLPASFTVNALQAFNLGLPQTFNIGSGASIVSAYYPYYGAYAQDQWRVTKKLTLDYGIRYEQDVRKPPLPTDKNNVAPRLGFAWNPDGVNKIVLRGGYGIFYGVGNFAIDYVVNALNVLNGNRQIAQAFTSIQTPGPASAVNVYATLLRQGVIGIPASTRQIQPGDLAQFGITFPHTGPLPPFSAVFEPSKDFVSSYTQQSSLSVEARIGPNFSLEVGGMFSRSLRIPRARDSNLLAAPVDAALGIRVWSHPSDFVNPLVAERQVSESTANASFSALTVELRKRLSASLNLGANYALSRAIDDVVDFNYEFEASDQTNLRAEQAPSSFSQKQRVIIYGNWTSPKMWSISGILRANSGQRFNLLVGYDLNQDRNPFNDRPPFSGRNTGIGPAFYSLDLRVSKEFKIHERSQFQLTAEAFNVLNHLNFATVNNVVGNMSGPFKVTGRDDRLPTEPLGFSSAFESRKIQLGLRVSF